jgi:hypothetical protein
MGFLMGGLMYLPRLTNKRVQGVFITRMPEDIVRYRSVSLYSPLFGCELRQSSPVHSFTLSLLSIFVDYECIKDGQRYPLRTNSHQRLGSIASLLSVPSSNVTAIAEKITPIYLPTYHAFDFGTVKRLNRSDILAGAAAQWQHMRDGVGTNVKLLYPRVEAVSNESAFSG